MYMNPHLCSWQVAFPHTDWVTKSSAVFCSTILTSHHRDSDIPGRAKGPRNAPHGMISRLDISLFLSLTLIFCGSLSMTCGGGDVDKYGTGSDHVWSCFEPVSGRCRGCLATQVWPVLGGWHQGSVCVCLCVCVCVCVCVVVRLCHWWQIYTVLSHLSISVCEHACIITRIRETTRLARLILDIRIMLRSLCVFRIAT